MSRYVTSLIERARGTGAMLEPRPRGRFEPGGVAEMEVESAVAAVSQARSLPSLSVSLSRSDTTNVNNTLTNVTNVASPVAMEPEGRLEARETPPQIHENTTLRLETARVTERSERVERERTQHETRERETLERERLTQHDRRTTERSERSERTERSVERVTERERLQIEKEAAPIHITIGRVDVRAIAPQAQPPRAPAKPKAPAPLTLDDYLRGKR